MNLFRFITRGREARNKLLKKSLRHSEGQLQTLIRTIPDLIWLKDVKGVYLSCNQAFERFFGATEAEIIGKTDYDFVDRDLADFFRNNDRKAMEARKSLKNEEWITFASDGHRALLETTKTPMYDSKGKLIGVLGIGHDITERKRAEDVLREEEQKFRALFEQAGDYAFIMEFDDDQIPVIIDANESALCFFNREDVIGRKISEIDPNSEKFFYEKIHRLMKGESLQFETLHRRKDGSGLIVEVTAKAVQIPGRTPILLSTARDITLKKRAEEELIKAKEEAESADRLKSAFLATMSHELRTPLNSIIGFSSILMQERAGTLNEEQKKQLTMVRNSGQHLLSLINDILDLSKIESGQLTINLDKFDIAGVLNDIIQLQEPFAYSKGIVLNFCPCAETIELISDRQRIHQVILNLVNNAIKFTEKGSVNVKCEKDGNFIRIEISDSGIGIAEEDVPKLFFPFSQVESHLSRKFNGTGLGLSICRKLVKMLDGTISVKSTLGVGSTFMVSFPVQEAEQESERKKRPDVGHVFEQGIDS